MVGDPCGRRFGGRHGFLRRRPVGAPAASRYLRERSVFLKQHARTGRSNDRQFAMRRGFRAVVVAVRTYAKLADEVTLPFTFGAFRLVPSALQIGIDFAYHAFRAIGDLDLSVQLGRQERLDET